MATRLFIDIETFSSVPIKTSGAYKYTESPDFEILLVAYSIDKGPVRIIDLASGDNWTPEFLSYYMNPEVHKYAHNATFERICFKAIGMERPINEWYCTAVLSSYCGLPLKLEEVSKALNLGDKGKLATGKMLIKYFCTPCDPKKSNNFRRRNFPHHDPEKWEDFKTYCINDVIAEISIFEILYRVPKFERDLYILDQEINDRGVLIDMNMVEKAIRIDNEITEELINNVKKLTGIDNPNSPLQLKEWLSNATGKNVNTLAKDSVVELLNEVEEGAVSEVLNNRLSLAKSSTKKYIAMINCHCYDNRARGLFQFYGAGRTGRWAGRMIQLQNLPQNHLPDLDLARKLIVKGDIDTIQITFNSTTFVLSELIRTALIAPPGKTFAVCDFSAIEARVLSWVAQEEWRLEVFRTHGKIYEASAAMMFNVPIESVTKGSDLRQKGKTAELALGYQGSEGAMGKMDRDNKISEQDRKIIVNKWRKANPKIVKFWDDVEKYSIHCIKTKKSLKLGFLGFHSDEKTFQIELPSGRRLFYRNPRLSINKFGKESIIFEGMDQTIKQWSKIDTYGGKLTENIVQAISRDILGYSMITMSKNLDIVMHIHDEVVCEVLKEDAEYDLELMKNIMSEEIPWAPGLPLKGDGYITDFYKKD